MYPASALIALGLGDADVARAREEGHVVGKGEGFVSIEWRAPDGRILALHFDESGRELACVVPFVGGLGWETWTLAAVREAEASPHLSTATVEGHGAAITAVLPDFAARRKMFPIGLEVKASVVVVVEEWRRGELEAFVSAIAGDAAGGVVVSGRVAEIAPLGPGVKVAIERSGARVWLCGAASSELSVGASITASGHALVRIGGPVVKRGTVQ